MKERKNHRQISYGLPVLTDKEHFDFVCLKTTCTVVLSDADWLELVETFPPYFIKMIVC